MEFPGWVSPVEANGSQQRLSVIASIMLIHQHLHFTHSGYFIGLRMGPQDSPNTVSMYD